MNPRAPALFTDFDGTLSPIVLDPAMARPASGAVEALVQLAPRYRRVAVLSGRPLSYLQPLLPPAVDIGALYGLEQRVNGERHEHPEAARWRPVIDELVAEAQRALAGHAGVNVEPKGLSVTVHFRNASADAAVRVSAWAEAAADRSGVRCQGAKASVELHPPVAIDKGSLLTEWAAGAATVAYFGDDLGDLTAFAALRSLRDRGVATAGVVATSDETPQAVRDAADVLLDGPPAVVALFQRLAAAS